MVKKVLVKKDKKFYWKKGDMHTHYGVLREEELKKAKGVIKSHNGQEFEIFDANFLDQLNNIKRGPQTLMAKDLAYILYYSGVDKNSLVVDAGSGCGKLAAVLGKYAKKVVTYDHKEENSKLAKANCKFLGVENVEFKVGDVYEKIDEKNVDVLTLDLPEPWQVDLSCVKSGGTIIVYLPTTTQIAEFCNSCKDHVVKVVELIEREWHVEGRKVRPKSAMIGHTAFLIIVRKL